MPAKMLCSTTTGFLQMRWVTGMPVFCTFSGTGAQKWQVEQVQDVLIRSPPPMMVQHYARATISVKGKVSLDTRMPMSVALATGEVTRSLG